MSSDPFPTESLYGPFPSFPVNYIRIPNLVDLPSYIYQVTTYYGNPFNYPYVSPPMISSWKIPYPNLLGIPAWFAQILAWGVGWIGAVLYWIVVGASQTIGGIFLTAVNTVTGLFTTMTKDILDISQRAGIFSPAVAAFLFGIVLVMLFLTVGLAIKGIQAILEAE